MDPSFWQGIIDADFAIPAGSSVTALTPHLLSYLNSTDPQLRDSFGFSILAVWIDRGGFFAPNQLRELGPKMLTNLSVGLGESDTDTVFGPYGGSFDVLGSQSARGCSAA